MYTLVKQVRRKIYWLVAKSPFSRSFGRLIGTPIRTKDGWVDVGANCLPQTKTCIRLGIYELAEKYLIDRHLPSGCDCIEFGASIGIISLRILKKLDHGHRHIAVEASPSNIPILQANISSNSAADKSSVMHKALAYNTRFVSFGAGNDNLAGRITDGTENEESVDVPAITLDEIRPKSNYSVVMDVEGAEYDMMENDSLHGCSCLIVELHGTQEKKLRFVDWARSQGLHLVEKKHRTYCFIRTLGPTCA
jgi:FkbM family methyltransferase